MNISLKSPAMASIPQYVPSLEHPNISVSRLFMESPLGIALAPLMYLALKCLRKVEVRSGLSLLNF